ncbi:carotenoid oxygenase family protein [Actinomadura opuntiae]|uniref:carotenoid oxygenase family protein n=1 Tax=Actinomadura sp. OS1-43 TaxID=604315 RepID=UPI00255A81A3|nr:carotenoid oxygenase family protein [Actinomadura sp. OS1-43]MDL4817349.1 carotenoid oxygenase family protein [Actinomadura sp. OS1-43]
MTTTPQTPFALGNYRPVRDERTLTTLPVTGRIPAHLDGRYVRNGTNPVAEIDPATYSWINGDGMVHGVRLRDGRAEWYRNRWIRTPAIAGALGERPHPPRYNAGFTMVAANTHVFGHADRTLALMEGGFAAYEVTDELDAVGPCDFGGTLGGGYTGHPKIDPVTGEMHAVSWHLTGGSTVLYSVIGTDGRARRIVPVRVNGHPLIHDMGLTARHVLIYDLPAVVDTRAVVDHVVPGWVPWPARLALSVALGRVRLPHPLTALMAPRNPREYFPAAYRWDADHPARVGIMPRDGDNGTVRWFEVDPCYVFHTINAYDDVNTVVCDVVRHATTGYAGNPDVSGTRPPHTVCRWTFDLMTGGVTETDLDDLSQELPRTDDRRLGRHYRYAYTVNNLLDPARDHDAVIRRDFRTGTTSERILGPRVRCGEFSFVPNSDDSAEDDGVLIGFTHDEDRDTSDLTLLDAATLETVASVHLPYRVPYGFHGNWIPTRR